MLVAILVALSLSGVNGAGKRSMSKGTYDTIIKMIKGEFDVPVGQRTLEKRNAIVRFWRNQESYQLNEDDVLLCDGKLVITQSEIKNVIRTEFDQSKGKGPRKMRFRLGEKYSGVIERRIQHVLDRSRRYQILKARFNNKVVLHPIRAKAVHTRHQCDLVDLRKWSVQDKGRTLIYIYYINHGRIQPLCLVAAHLLQNKRDTRKSSVIVVPRNWLPISASARQWASIRRRR